MTCNLVKIMNSHFTYTLERVLNILWLVILPIFFLLCSKSLLQEMIQFNRKESDQLFCEEFPNSAPHTVYFDLFIYF